MNQERLLDDLREAAREAADAILQVARRGFETATKGDRSPVTDADHAAEMIILEALARVAPGVPVIAEEEVAAGRIPTHGNSYFLVDPLDGTKEFIGGNNDYTVNIGFIEHGTPIMGVICAPATGLLYSGDVNGGAWVEGPGSRQPIRTRQRGDEMVAVASRSHLDAATVDYLQAVVGDCAFAKIGSSLKFCIVAEGKADIYPRGSPTSEWDTAAGHAILLAAGGLVDGLDGAPLHYGKSNFLNPGFVATSGWKAPRLDAYLAT